MKTKKNEILKLRNELSTNFKSLSTTKDIKKWYKKIIKKSNIKTKTIPLLKCNNWKINNKGQIIKSLKNNETGNIEYMPLSIHRWQYQTG